ncbi:hypothetical protein VB796_21665 [Arcicella sp. LKC2W]|uniref:hypothetical protein n=1 Tax=Arcicella sp. LKC2W TaxID=2984198 RepID=UPI002B1FDD90|nr:hypothetical protein [Arcicella sp. LKC2W]MEA5461691.1 hypothetical protein [Arcicella sp. LKC2W]
MKSRIKKSYICSDVNDYQINLNLIKSHIPTVGDIAIFEVLNIGKHSTIQGESTRNEKIMVGDHIMAAFGHRYATAQFEGYVPDKIQTEFHILGAGGVIGEVKSTNDKFKDGGPTRLRIIGYVTDSENKIINTKTIHSSQMLTFTGSAATQTKVVLSIGSSMDSGKTTTAAYVVHSLIKQGKTVAFIKITGTAYTKDADLAYDLGASISIDFSKLGFPSTYMCSENELLNLYETLLEKTLLCEPDYVIMEIADGIYQRETRLLLQNEAFVNSVSEVIFSANDSMAAVCGVQTLRSWGIQPFALCGMFTTSPLLIEEVEALVETPIYSLKGWDKEGATELITYSGINKSRRVESSQLFLEVA